MMTVQHLEAGVSLKHLLSDIAEVSIDVDISMLSLDARNVTEGGLFLAVSGTQRHGMQYAKLAIKNGATAIIYDPVSGGDMLARKCSDCNDVVMVELDNLSQYVSEIASRFYHHPSKEMSVIGITGTNGKTSISHFIARAMSARQSCAVIGTLGWGFVDRLTKTLNTTPDAVSVQYCLMALLNNKAQAVAMEVSSHGLQQGRVTAVDFDGAIFTNLSHDHLDYHGSMTAYGESKLMLFKSPQLKFAVVNLDDDYSTEITKVLAPSVKLFGYSHLMVVNERVDEYFYISDETFGVNGLSFSLGYQGQQYTVNTGLLGGFNIDNVVATMAVLMAQGWGIQEAVGALADLENVPGRMQRISLDETLPLVVVDFAHTPDALASVLNSVREYCEGQLRVIFGCGGDRDSSKRELMGQVANLYADSIIVTNDNPRYEDAEQIAKAIMLGVGNENKAEIVLDRELAINKAIDMATAKDVIVVAGKGHEEYQQVAGRSIPFSDTDVVISALKRRLSGGAK